ncbi:MAG: Fic family protein [Kiritimatiellae bacterium]|nr:Fic family protein [Kiritimatiellia bacterium]
MSSGNYAPPYTISERAVTLVAEIAAALERYRIAIEGPDGVRLRKINHIRTIRGTTAIEGNTLTEEQVTAILAGKRVVAPAREIAEVKCAHMAYSMLGKIDPFRMDDVLKVHSVMMDGLVQGAGSLRTGGVGVVDGLGHVIHMAPPAGRVPELLGDLLGWAKSSAAHPLLKSSVFHYEFEFIHPFFDGNGRMGRFLQTAMLGKWNPLFHAAPIENIVFENQAGYYEAINASTNKADSGPFVDFMLERILAAIKAKGEVSGAAHETTEKTTKKTTEKSREETKEKNRVKSRVKSRVKTPDRILRLLRDAPDATRIDIAEALGLSVKAVEKNLAQLKADGRLRRVGPDKGGHWEVVE